MYCLHCGDCCLRMSPKSAPEPCPNLVQINNFYFCDDYEHRPQECQQHNFPSRFCPIGIDKLKLSNPDEIRNRIDTGDITLKTIKRVTRISAT